MAAPLYSHGQQVYVRESANLGFLEGYYIDTVLNQGGGWVYTILPTVPTPVQLGPVFGERIAKNRTAEMYFNEDELATYCDALLLAQAALQRRLAAIEIELAARCPSDTTG